MTNLELARLLHETYERLAPRFGYETRPDTRVFDPESPNGQLMRALAHEVRNHFLTHSEPREEPLPPGCIRVVVCAGCGQHDTMGAYHLDMCPAFSGPIRPKSA